MRKFIPRPGLVLLPAACLLTSCASYNAVQSPPGTVAGTHEFLYVQATWYTGTGDFDAQSATYGFAVSPSGELTALAGYPIQGWFWGVASGKYYFTPDPDNMHLDTYEIGTDGSFTKVHSVLDQVAAQCTGPWCGVDPDLTDPTGSSLYVHDSSYNSGDGAASPETYSIDKATGELAYVGQGGADWTFSHGGCQFYNFSGDDRYAYGSCGGEGGYWLDVAVRNSDGTLTDAPQIKVAGPTPPSGIVFSGTPEGTDSDNHLAAVLSSTDTYGDPVGAPPLLVSYTINPDGSLTTTNTIANMPTLPQTTTVAGLSPSGKLFAIGVQGGIQLFNFNGAAPMTVNGGVIPTDPPQVMKWDTQNHLFVLSSTQKLYVFTISGNSLAQAPGSPYSIPKAGYFVSTSF